MNDNKMSILLCEDDENLGMLLREYLQAKGYETTLCTDGDIPDSKNFKGRCIGGLQDWRR